MRKHKKGSIIAVILSLIFAAVVGFLFFNMIKDQIIFESVEQVETVEKLDVTLDEASRKQIDNYTSQQVSNKDNTNWRDASDSEIKEAMDSSKFMDNQGQKYQFLDLSKYQGIDKNRIKRMLYDHPTLLSHTDDFVNAAKDKQVNEVYLISHALLETGSVMSELSNGVEIDGKKYYNFYGVGALDRDPIQTGAEYAKKKGWDTPEKAIEGGAEFIHDHYLSNPNQNTLYSMRWNPKNPGEHQYATDINWAKSNASIIASFYKDMKTEGKYFNWYVYKGDQKHIDGDNY
ncbi:autolysin [Staphylococcus felis]|uniref:Autolysin n=1 Tax=Staphylococcus felis TaxID=46127 RepID=A0A2K3ZFJ7_9STAP|nr:N-acetylglucosaminidase [Staphylococcus felis]AVP37353.1 autolysin [Staphylococcus felis]MBH9580202.1 N-acetylglucosaminidase [Staphylococcus felis]MDM8328576.1 N-acetylglucosaminidase [Staphylococcus felis]MDQ7193417.1 N-acetylglucosaminidase [Staphylococcus felis]PNZ36637.1 autolysin [Staphylococcus felis]